MNSISKTYKELASPYFAEVFSLIEKICNEQNIPVYLIGAHAKVILLLAKGIKPARATKDIDFAIMIPDQTSYDNFLASMEELGFKRMSEPYRVIYEKTDTIVDVLPFGQIEEAGTIKFTDRKTELSVLGLSEVLESAIQIEHEGFEISILPFVGILILKLISWNEKPDRKKDLDDAFEIIKDYFEISEDSFFQNHNEMVDELSTDNFMLEAGSFMVGIDMEKIINRNTFLRNAILKIIQAEIDETPGSISLYFLQKEYLKDYQIIQRIFALIKKGMIV